MWARITLETKVENLIEASQLADRFAKLVEIEVASRTAPGHDWPLRVQIEEAVVMRQQERWPS